MDNIRGKVGTKFVGGPRKSTIDFVVDYYARRVSGNTNKSMPEYVQVMVMKVCWLSLGI